LHWGMGPCTVQKHLHSPMKTGLLTLVAALAVVLIARPARADEAAHPGTLSIAAAANLVYALDALDKEFAKTAPDVTVTSATGASGSLVAQIEHGAPYDVFLSADRTFPQALIKAGQGDANSLTEFAVGRLVLWTTNPSLNLSDIAGAVQSQDVKRLAIANVLTAPFGRAAKEALQKLGAWDAVQTKLVFGENISQTAQFVQTGNADAGFVALSLVLAPNLKDKGHWTEVPPTLFGPLEQCAVITAHGIPNPASARYIAFLHSPAARGIFEQFGYGVPTGP
jgi:molybdate transport system substrate-binding protein